MSVFLIPLSPEQQRIDISLGEQNFTLRFMYNKMMQTWTLDLYDADQNPLVMGTPLVTGYNILEQYLYLGIKGRLVVFTEGDPDKLPTIDSLGVETNLYYVEYSE